MEDLIWIPSFNPQSSSGAKGGSLSEMYGGRGWGGGGKTRKTKEWSNINVTLLDYKIIQVGSEPDLQAPRAQRGASYSSANPRILEYLPLITLNLKDPEAGPHHPRAILLE